MPTTHAPKMLFLSQAYDYVDVWLASLLGCGTCIPATHVQTRGRGYDYALFPSI